MVKKNINKRDKIIIYGCIFLMLFMLVQMLYDIGTVIDYNMKINNEEIVVNNLEDRVITVENRLDIVEKRVDKIEKEESNNYDDSTNSRNY